MDNYECWKNEVVTAVTNVGEIVGRLIEEDATHIKLKNPRAIMFNDNGYGLAMNCCGTGEHTPESIVLAKSNVIIFQKTHADIAKGWQQATSGIVL